MSGNNNDGLQSSVEERERKGAPGGGGFTQQRFLQTGSSPRSDLLNLLYTNLTDKGKK